MKSIFCPALVFLLLGAVAHAQLTVPLPDRQVVKLLPDYGRPTVYALNSGNGAVPGTLLALNSSNGAVLAEISVGLKPTDMAMSPAGEALYVINAGARTLMKVGLEPFAVTATRPFTTPNTYNPDLPLYIAAGPSDLLYFTDGGWSPGIYTFDFPGGTNVSLWDDDNGVGGLAATRDGTTLYTWRQYGWGAGNVNSWVTRFAIDAGVLNPQETSFVSWRRDPTDTPVLLNGPETAVFNKQQMFAATNVSVLLQSFAENIYAISLDGRVALGSTTLFNTQNGLELTNFSFASSVQSLSGDQRRLFRYRANVSEMYIYDMSQLASVSGPIPEPVPADGVVIPLRPADLAWSPSPVALGYRVYFGASQSEVATATTNSPQYLGQVTDTSIPLNRPMTPGSTYYWRLDRVGFSEVTTGAVWSFTVAPIAVVPQRLDVGAIAAYNPAPSTLSLTSSVPRSWTATIRGANWLSLSAASGTTPANISVSFTTTNLAVGVYSNIIDITSGGITAPILVTLDVRPLNITKMVTDYQRPYIYALQPAPFAGQSGRLLFINTASDQIEKALPIVGDSRDLSINYAEGRLYIVDGGVSGSLWRVDLNTQTVLPNLLVDPNHDRVNAGRAGRVVMEEWNQWVMVKLYDTTTNPATVLSSTMLREGDGEMSADGRFYYHCDNNSSAAGVSKWALTNDTFTLIGGGNGHPYGSRHLLLSPDGTRLFWRGFMYDTELSGPDTNIMAELVNLGAEIYATTIHGELAFSARSVFNTRNGQVLYSLPAQSTVIAVSGDQQKVFYYDAQQQRLRTVPMSDIAPLPAPGISPTPADQSIVGLPLAQLNWTVSPFALEYRVFFGTNQATVAAATTNSPLFAGAVTTTSIPVPTALQHNRTYYWRVDSVGFNNSVTGAVWRFTTAPVTVTPQALAIKGVAGLPILPETVNISAPSSTGWSVNTDQPWLSASPGAGATPASVTLTFNTSAFASGTYTNMLNFTAGGLTLRVPVSVELFNLEATRMLADRDRPYIYVLHRGSGSYDDAFLLFLNTDSGVVEKVLPIGRNPTDMSINRGENRLYVINSGTSFLQVVDLNTRTLLSPLPVYTSVDRVNAGRPGRVVVEEWNQWVNAYLLDTTNNAAILTTAFFREGDGEFDPTGRYYYHSDNNISGAGMTKYDLNNSTFVSVGGVGGHYYYGSRHIVMSLDGSRLFWTGAAYDANLVDLGNIGVEIYACTTNGAIAFSSERAYDTATRQAIFNLPATTTVMAVDRRDQRLWYFHPVSKQIQSLSLGVIRAPSITQQPTGATVPVGAPVYMTVTATGYAPLAYQWLFTGTSLPGETNFFLSLTSAQPAQSGNYQVVVSNPYGSVTSTVAQVIVQVAPVVTQQPAGMSVSEGANVVLTVQASGTGPLRYQWSFEGANLNGATNAALAIPNVQSSHAGAYRVQVSNAAGSVTSSSAILRVTPAPPIIISGPTNVTVAAGNLAAFAVTVAGSAPFTYQWRFNGAPLTAPSSPSLVISNAQASHAGDYLVIVGNGLGAVTSAVARLTVNPSAPVFTLQPQGATVSAGTNNLTLAALARGTEPISYQWRRNGTNLAGATSASLVLSNVSPAHSGAYTVLASNAVGVTTSAVANVIITGSPPVFVQQPESQSLLAGNTLMLSSRASGSEPLSYQWRRNGTNLVGAISRILTISNASPAHSGAYSVLASNAFGVATSATANINVINPPSFVLTLTNMAVDAGTNVNLFVVAQSSAPVNFSWQFNGIALPVSSGSNLFLTNVQAAHSGTYRVTAANQHGSVSARMHLTVFPRAGTVFTWGDDIAGQSTVPPGLANVVRVAGGDFHSLALRRDGSVAAWGYDGYGQVSTPALSNIVAIAAGASHNLAVGLDGRIIAWGNNDYGQTQVPNSATSVVAVAAGEAHSVALRQDGTFVAWGDGSRGQVDLTQAGFVTSIAAGRNHTIALRNDRTVLGWGLNSHGQRTAPQGLNNVTAIAAGYLHSLALRADGTVVAWGDNTYGQTTVPVGLSNVIAIAAGELHSLALRSDGVVVAWGDNIFDQSNVPASLDFATGVASGYYHSLAIVPVPTLGFAKRADGLVLWWNGNCMLQQATSASGPFTDVTAASPCTNLWSQQTSARFFRLRPLY